MIELIDLAERLRAFYPADNRLGLLLDELIKDLREGAPREEIVADALALRAELEPRSAAYAVIGTILSALEGLANEARKPKPRKPRAKARPAVQKAVTA